jgi:phage gpG-like protein
MRIGLQIENEQILDREINRFSNGAQDFRVIAPTLLVTIRDIVREQFAAQGRGLFGRWRKLSDRYAQWKARKYPGQPILRASDRMFNSLMSRTQYSIVSLRKTELIYGTRVRYASFHQTGTAKMARRPIFDLRDADKERLIKNVQARLVRLTKTGR